MYTMNSLFKAIIVFALSFIYPVALFADGNSINKIEHPYVQAEEKEVSLSSFYQKNNDENKYNLLKYKLSIGRSFTDRWFGEVAILGNKNTQGKLESLGYELEAKWQITEQGEYAADYGLLFEYENEQNINIKEASISLLVERQWGQWVSTTNITGIYEWGRDINNEFETALAAQVRYRYRSSLEPAMELYLGEKNKGIGPVLTGIKRLAPGKKINWEVGVILGLGSSSPKQTVRALLEYEF